MLWGVSIFCIMYYKPQDKANVKILWTYVYISQPTELYTRTDIS